ncbi:MAG TPA: hypothetical protein VMV84_06580 [Dehalococcoidales bacterium]|nr:hypothetical protein [Dehalococcoidales bacterium]
MSEITSDELKQKILKYLDTVTRVKVRAVHTAIGEDKKLVDKAMGKLASEGKVEYLYLETSYVKLAGKEIPGAERKAI